MKKIFFCLVVLICMNSLPPLMNNNLEAKETEKDLFSRSNKLIKISLGYIKLKKYGMAELALNSAYQMAKNIEEPLSQATILYEITDKYIMLNKNLKALRVARSIEFGDVRCDAFSNIAYSYVEQGEFNKAIAIAKKIEDNFTKALWLYKAVNKLTEQGLYEEAVKMATAINSQYPIFNDLINAQVCTKKMSKIDDYVTDMQFSSKIQSLNDPYSKARELVDAADRYFSVILFEPAKKLLSEAVLISKDINPESLRKDILYKKDIVSNKINNFQKYYRLNDDKD